MSTRAQRNGPNALELARPPQDVREWIQRTGTNSTTHRAHGNGPNAHERQPGHTGADRTHTNNSQGALIGSFEYFFDPLLLSIGLVRVHSDNSRGSSGSFVCFRSIPVRVVEFVHMRSVHSSAFAPNGCGATCWSSGWLGCFRSIPVRGMNTTHANNKSEREWTKPTRKNSTTLRADGNGRNASDINRQREVCIRMDLTQRTEPKGAWEWTERNGTNLTTPWVT